MEKEFQTAVFAAGCFWGVQYVFDKIPGVFETTVGYIGGDEKIYPKPNYDLVCMDRTGYAEAVKVVFDTSKTTYKELLEVFWKIHDSTTPNRQGPDVGTQYRAAVFYLNDEQKKQAEAFKKAFQKKLGSKKVVTEIARAGKFFPAEEYHQKYYKKNPNFVCHIKI